MKIAVCFFGITRNLRQNTLASIERHLLGPVLRLDPACRRFGHFNLPDKVHNPRTGETGVAVEPNEHDLLRCDFVAATAQEQVDQEIDFSSIEAFGDVWEDGFSSLRNLLRQLYSLNRVTGLLMESGEQFDLVIYTRADLRFDSEVVIPRIRPGPLYTPWFSKGGGLNDRFALGDQGTMIHYGQRASMARQYCQELHCPLHAERLLAWVARKRQLRTADLTEIKFSRVRANGTVPDWDVLVHQRFKHRMKHLWSRIKNRVCGDY